MLTSFFHKTTFPHKTTRFCAVILLLSLSTLFSQDEEESAPAQNPPTKLENYLQAPPNPTVYPLTLLDGEALKEISIMDRELLHFSGTLKNISDKAVKITNIRSNCSCLQVDAYNDITLNPADTLTVKCSLDAKTLLKDDENNFGKKIIVTAEGFPITFISIAGTVKNMFTFDPAQVIDLGEFTGDISSWKRTINIKSLFPQEKLELKLPPNNRFFNLAITRVSPQDFQLVLTPKSPFPINVIKESINLDVEGIPNYGPVQIMVLGKTTGIHFALQWDRKYINREKLPTDASYEFDVPITLRSLLPKGPERGMPRKRRVSKVPIATLPVQEDEQKVRPWDKPETWLPFISDLTIKNLPDCVKVTLLSDNMGIKARFSLDPQYKEKGPKAFSSMFYYKNQYFGNLLIKVK